MTDALEIFNIIFTTIFALEMLLKIIAFGPYGYIKDAYNLFDGVIVIVRYGIDISISSKLSIFTVSLNKLVLSTQEQARLFRSSPNQLKSSLGVHASYQNKLSSIVIRCKYF